MKEDTYIVYIKPDANGRILSVCSSAFLKDASGWTEIDRGQGFRYYHAQGNYFDGGLFTADLIPRYKWDGAQALLRTEEEMEADRNREIPPVVSTEEDLMAMAVDHEYRLTLLELGV